MLWGKVPSANVAVIGSVQPTEQSKMSGTWYWKCSHFLTLTISKWQHSTNKAEPTQRFQQHWVYTTQLWRSHNVNQPIVIRQQQTRLQTHMDRSKSVRTNTYSASILQSSTIKDSVMLARECIVARQYKARHCSAETLCTYWTTLAAEQCLHYSAMNSLTLPQM